MAGKISAREEKAANKEAEAVLASLSRAGEAAVTQTLDDIREVLKKDAPLMYHINALLHNQEWTAVLKASINGIAAVAPSGDKPAKGWRLRAGIRKFGHLERRVVQLLCFFNAFASNRCIYIRAMRPEGVRRQARIIAAATMGPEQRTALSAPVVVNVSLGLLLLCGLASYTKCNVGKKKL